MESRSAMDGEVDLLSRKSFLSKLQLNMKLLFELGENT